MAKYLKMLGVSLPNPAQTQLQLKNGCYNVQSFDFRNYVRFEVLTFKNAAFIGSFTFKLSKIFLELKRIYCRIYFAEKLVLW